jgi:hypothetical protein
VPVAVRVSGASVVAGTAGAPGQVALTLRWQAPTSGPVPSSYEVRWMVVGGPQNRLVTSVDWSTATTGRVVVPIPASGAWIRWEVRSVLGSTSSRWVVARAVVPTVVGRRVANARASLRALGIITSTYSQPAAAAASVGRVLAQSSPAGRVVTPGSSIALAVGKKA